MWYELVVSGGCCPRNFRIGVRFTKSFGDGEITAFGSGFTIDCERKSVKQPARKRFPLSTVSRIARLREEKNGVMLQAKKSPVAWALDGRYVAAGVNRGRSWRGLARSTR